jgi:outer membrane protein TolC
LAFLTNFNEDQNGMKLWPLILGIALFTGCAHFHPQPISPEKTAALLDSRRLDDAGLKKFLEQDLGRELKDWPRKNWDLPELTLAAFYFHPGLEVARAQWLVAVAGVKTAGARPNPSVSVTPGYDTQIPGNYSPWFVPVVFDLPLETAGKRGKRIAEAEKNSEVARWNFVSVAWQIRNGVRASLLDLKIAERRAGLLQEQFAAQKQILKLLQERFEAGEISRPEAAIAQIALNKTQLDLGDARSKSAEARARLGEALGLTEAALQGQALNFDFSEPEVKTLTSAEARGIALQSRADVLAALAGYAASEADLRLQVAKQYPDLHVGPAYAWNSGQAGDNQWSLGVTLELPILDQNQGPIAEAEARRKLAAAQFLALQAQVVGEIDRAVAGFRVARDQLQAGRDLLATDLQQRKSAEAQIKAGAGDPLDVLAAQLELSSAALVQLDNEAKLQIAFGALEDALQRPADSIAAVIKNISEKPSHFSK